MAEGEKPFNFKSGKSSDAVTTKVKIGRIGNMTLIDTPGTNDANKQRQDKHIHIEIVNTIRDLLTSEDQGINSFCQCVMPDSSDRIRLSAIQAMNNILLTLQSFDPKTDPFKHPKMKVIFNNVSKFN